MLLTITTTRAPATDLGFLLHKHPDRAQSFAVAAGQAHVFYPEATPERCTAALLLEVDPIGLVRDRKGPGTALGQYVNDRPYAASSMLAVAIKEAFRTALTGRCDARPALAAEPIPLELHVPALRCRGGGALAQRVFAPLGWTVDTQSRPLTPREWGDSPYLDLRLTGELRLADALNHLYVLLPVLDDAKHYWVSTEEVDKLIRAGGDWLAGHPEKELITRRYLSHQKRLTRSALARLAEADDTEPEELDNAVPEEAPEEIPAETPGKDSAKPLAVQRREAILAVLARGRRPPGRRPRLRRGRADPGPAADRRHRPRRGDRRVRPGAAAGRPPPEPGPDAGPAAGAADDLPVLAHLPRRPAGRAGRRRADGGHRAPGPRPDPRARAGRVRRGRARHRRRHHPQRRVQRALRRPGTRRGRGTRTTASSGPGPQFRAWAGRVADAYGYQVRFLPVGPEDPRDGPPTQLAVFARRAEPWT